MSHCPAVLFVAWSRPDPAKQVFARIRQAKPSRFYFGVDGLKGESRRDGWQAVKDLARQVDWDCEVRTRFLETNEGPGKAVGGAIDWFFQHEDEGIILEEDCLPDPSFFDFCREALARYRDEPTVMLVSGSNLCWQMPAVPACRFATHPSPWGWASWRRAWQTHNPATLAPVDDWGDPSLRAWLGSDAALRLWQYRQKANVKGWVDTWDFGWHLNIIRHRGLCLLPQVNMISNIGCGADSTHTGARESLVEAVPARAHPMPITFPAELKSDPEIDEWNLWQILGHHPLVAETAAEVTKDVLECIQPAKDMRKAARDLARAARHLKDKTKSVHGLRKFLPARADHVDVLSSSAQTCQAAATKLNAAAACLEGLVATRGLHTNPAAGGAHLYARISYSKEGEDLILTRIFDGQADGFYVDMNACHPYRFSNTWIFYQRGWQGINYHPGGNMRDFHLWRPRDINLPGEINSPGTGSPDNPAAPVRTLPDILGQYPPPGSAIDFLNLAGCPLDSLAGMDWSRHRPRVILCESPLPVDPCQPRENPVVARLLDSGYHPIASTPGSVILASR